MIVIENQQLDNYEVEYCIEFQIKFYNIDVFVLVTQILIVCLLAQYTTTSS